MNSSKSISHTHWVSFCAVLLFRHCTSLLAGATEQLLELVLQQPSYPLFSNCLLVCTVCLPNQQKVLVNNKDTWLHWRRVTLKLPFQIVYPKSFLFFYFWSVPFFSTATQCKAKPRVHFSNSLTVGRDSSPSPRLRLSVWQKDFTRLCRIMCHFFWVWISMISCGCLQKHGLEITWLQLLFTVTQSQQTLWLFFLSCLQLGEPRRGGHQRLQPAGPDRSEQPGGPGDPDSWRAPRAHHWLRRHRLGPGLWLVGAGEAESLRKHRVAPLHVRAGPAAAGHRPQQRSHQDLGRLH